jgi:hypothetical protein
MIKGKAQYWRSNKVYRFLGISSTLFYSRLEQGEYEEIECLFDGINCWYNPMDVAKYAFPELSNVEKAKIIIEFNRTYNKYRKNEKGYKT